MDFIEGETLQQKMQKNGPMDFDSCIRLMTPIMQSLAEVHKHGIIHRDISPDNIMVQPDGKPVLLDLGAAKDLDIQGKDGSIQTTQMVAKQGFSPIEQYRKNASVGPWTDVYSMAATIYYCCTGTLPPTSVDRIVEDTLTCKPRLTKEQFDVLAAGMSILPQKRPQDMAALLQIVTRLQKGGKAEPVKPDPQAEPAKAQRTPPVPPRPADVKPPVKNAPPKTPQKKPLPAWLIPAVAGVVAVLGIVVCIVTATGKTPRQNVSMKAAATEPVLQPAPAETTPKTTTPKATVPKATEPKPEPTTKPTQPKNHIEYVDGYWESTNLKDGNFSLNVHALVFYTPLVRCREMTVNMEVSMNAGTKCKEWQVWLVCIEGATKGTDYRIHSQNNYIGRSARMDISIPGDPHISAENSAIIAYDNEDRTFYFGPGSGRNIVRVNGKPALSVEKIEAYDVLTIGTTKLLFVPLCGDRFDWNEKK